MCLNKHLHPLTTPGHFTVCPSYSARHFTAVHAY
jgi:hypothetical protein